MDSFYNIATTNFLTILSVLYLLTIIFICLMIVVENRSPVKTLSWITVVLLVPVIGFIFYVFFGQNYRKEKIFTRKSARSIERLRRYAARQAKDLPIKLAQESDAIRAKGHLMKLMINNNRSVLTEFNKIELLIDGKTNISGNVRGD